MSSSPTFWQQNLTALLDYYKSSVAGLTSFEASERLIQYGPNVFQPQRSNALLFQYLSKFSNPLVIILLVASSISAFTATTAILFYFGWDGDCVLGDCVKWSNNGSISGTL